MKIDQPVSLDEACEFIVDCLHKTAPIEETGYPSIRTPNVGRGRLILTGVNRVSEQTYTEWTRRAVPITNDLILAREAPAGNVAIIKNGQTVCLGQRTVHLRPNALKVDPDFLCYFLLAPRQQAELLAGETGVTAGHVNMRDIRRLPLVGLPPLNEQRFIGSVLAAYDDLLANNERRIELLEYSARLLFEEWFVRLHYPGHEHDQVVDGCPVGWSRQPFSKVVAINPRERVSKNSELWYVPMASLSESGMLLDEAYFERRSKHTTVKFRNGDTLFARITPCLENGKTGYVDFLGDGEVACGSTEFIVMRGASLPPEFVYCLARQDYVRGRAIKSMIGSSGRQRVQGGCFDELLVSVPPRALMSEFQDFSRDCFMQIKNLRKQNQKLARARDLLLPRLIDGRIAV